MTVLRTGTGASADPSELARSVDGFEATLPGTSAVRIDVGDAGQLWHRSSNAEMPLLVGSAVKTFILAAYLQTAEQGVLGLNDPLSVDDRVRNVGSPTLLTMSGTLPARMVLEAMMAHGDNTATDLALRTVGVDRVRALIGRAGLTSVQIPDSTRIMFSYLGGAQDGTNVGWPDVQDTAAGRTPGEPRAAVNPVQSMLASVDDLVDFYAGTLAGAYFDRAETLVEFKRIQAMADAIAVTVPPDILAYAKGGNLDWGDFHAICLAGQIIRRQSREADRAATFCFTCNWHGPTAEVGGVTASFITGVRAVLAAAAAAPS